MEGFQWPAVAALISLLTAAYFVAREFWGKVSRTELNQILAEQESRWEKRMAALDNQYEKSLIRLQASFDEKIEQLRKTMMSLHEDNRHARHELADRLNAPMLNLGHQLSKIREKLEHDE